jgi:fumarate reductase subunit C
MAAETSPRPRQYTRHRPLNWWTKNPRYTLFIFRELSAGFLALYAILLFRLMHRAGDPQAWDQIIGWLMSPVSIVLHVVVLAFALLNTWTTFTLAPRVLKLHRGEEPVPESAISGAHWAAFLVVTIVLIAIALRLG